MKSFPWFAPQNLLPRTPSPGKTADGLFASAVWWVSWRRSPRCWQITALAYLPFPPYIPLDHILVETDAPYILHYCKDVLPPKLLRRTWNTSLIIPAVIEKIAELQRITAKEVEMAITGNTIRMFSLPIK